MTGSIFIHFGSKIQEMSVMGDRGRIRTPCFPDGKAFQLRDTDSLQIQPEGPGLGTRSPVPKRGIKQGLRQPDPSWTIPSLCCIIDF